MLNIKNTLEKNALNINNKESLVLLELEGLPNKNKSKAKRQKLNLSLVIDISGSMSSPIANVRNNSIYGSQSNNNFFAGVLGAYRENNSYNSKLDLTKKAAINAVEKMNLGDFVSLVVFDNKVDVLFESQEITESNRKNVIDLISGLKTRGGTDLHSGWLTGATEVAKTMKEKFINRVLVLTDGITFSGILDGGEICNNVAALNSKGVSTTTFGVGSDFNEDLLQGMSTSGGGNFYYIKSEDDFDDVFSQEFAGLLNIAGTEITVEFQLEEGFEIKEQLNDLQVKDNKYSLSDIATGKKVPLLFKMGTIIKKDFNIKNKIKVGELVLTYKDESGNKVMNVTTIEMDVMKNKKWEELEFNKEVKVQEMLLVIAAEKIKSGNLASAGNIEGAKSLLRSASAMAMGASFNDDRMTTALNGLEASVQLADTMGGGDFKKSMMYESYRSRTGKDV